MYTLPEFILVLKDGQSLRDGGSLRFFPVLLALVASLLTLTTAFAARCPEETRDKASLKFFRAPLPCIDCHTGLAMLAL